MNLADMLGYADIGQLGRIANTYQCECNGHSKNELIQSILQAIGRRDVFENQISTMKMEDLRFMNSLLFDPRNAFSLEELIARVQQSKFDNGTEWQAEDASASEALTERGASGKAGKTGKRRKQAKAEQPAQPPGPRDTIIRFKHYGWLFNGHAGPDRYLFHIPSDVKIRFREALERRLGLELQYLHDEPDAYRDEQQLLGEDVVELLTYVHHNEISLTVDGMMYKRNVLQMMERFGIREELPARGEWRFGYGRRMKEYPDRMSLLYDYCYYKGWISEQQALLALTPAGQERQMKKLPEAPDELYRFWLRLYKNAIPNLRSLVYWIDRLAAKWVSADSLKKALMPYIRPYYYDKSDAIFEQRIVAMMLHLGLLKLGEHELCGRVIRATPLGRAVVAGLNLDDDEALVLE
ncbi:hypothetical protein [Paenibacillus sp. GCM10027626]|uniref:hypothetical protein n=1 Tax=Paenibacillus sp. GCM10027626 TaxID=3273411 RepID=UPI00362A501F